MPDRIRPIKTDLFEKFLRYIGCEEDLRQGETKRKGGHRKYHRSDLKRPIIIQAKPEIPPMIILSNLRTLNMTRDEYLAILRRIK